MLVFSIFVDVYKATNPLGDREQKDLLLDETYMLYTIISFSSKDDCFLSPRIIPFKFQEYIKSVPNLNYGPESHFDPIY